MREFIYKLFRLEYERSFCANCEKLMHLLEDEKRRHDKLINNLLTPKEDNTAKALPEDFRPMQSRHTPWSVTQQRLEAADKIRAEEIKKAQSITNAKKKIEALEKEVGVPSFDEEVEKVENA